MFQLIASAESERYDADYSVRINGREAFVYAARVSAQPFNQIWPGYQRPVEQSELSSFVQAVSDEPLHFEVEVKKNFEEVKVRPLSKGITAEKKGRRVCFTIEQCGQYVLEADGHHGALHIFVDPVQDKGHIRESATHYFPAGVHRAGRIPVRSGDRIYIERGAVVYGTVLAENVHDVVIAGGGILDGGEEERTNGHCYESDSGGCIRFYDSSDIRIEDAILRDSSNWILSMFRCSDIVIENVKLVGHWKYNNDGIDLSNCRNGLIKNCFVRSFDDGIVLKGIPGYEHDNVENILVENCVVWCEWGRSLEIGAETVADYYNGIVFINCDLIHNSAVCLDVQNRSNADIRGVLFEDIRAEYSRRQTPEQVQSERGQKYSRCGEIHVPVLIRFENAHYTDWDFSSRYPYGISHDIRFRNISVISDEGLPVPACEFLGVDAEHKIRDIVIEDLTVNGRRMTDKKSANFFENEFTENIILR